MKNFSHLFPFYASEKLSTIWIFLWGRPHCEGVSLWLKYSASPFCLLLLITDSLPYFMGPMPKFLPIFQCFSLLNSYNVMADTLYFTTNEFQWLHLHWKPLNQEWITRFGWERLGMTRRSLRARCLLSLLFSLLPQSETFQRECWFFIEKWQRILHWMELIRQGWLYLRLLKQRSRLLQ